MSWLDKYLVYTERQVSPRVFHLWSGIAVIAGALERRCFMGVRGGNFVYPGQIMVVLVSKSAITKKTTAARMAVELLRELEPWQVHLLPKKLSPSSLLTSLQRLDDEKTPLRDPAGNRCHSAGFLFAGELGSFFSTEAFAETLATYFNDLNDCPRGKVMIEYRSYKAELWQPCVTMLGCITPKGIARELPKAARTAGFFGRLFLVHRNYTERRGCLLDEEDAMMSLSNRLKKELVQELAEIACMKGRYTATKGAAKWYQSWYYDVYEPSLRHMDLPESEQTGYYGRKDAHVLRVAMVLSASDRRDLVIEQRHFENSLQYLEAIEREFPHALAELGANPYTDFDRRCLEALERFNKTERWVNEKRLRRVMLPMGGDRRFIECRDTLVRAGEVQVKHVEDDFLWRRLYSSGRLLRGAGEQEDLKAKKEKRYADAEAAEDDDPVVSEDDAE